MAEEGFVDDDSNTLCDTDDGGDGLSKFFARFTAVAAVVPGGSCCGRRCCNGGEIDVGGGDGGGADLSVTDSRIMILPVVEDIDLVTSLFPDFLKRLFPWC